MKKLILLTLCSIVSYAMDYEEKPHPENQLQAIISNPNITSEEFKTYLEARPKLTEVTVNGHQMMNIPSLNIRLDGLRSLDVSNGTLNDCHVFPMILAMAPNLRTCKLNNNQIPALWYAQAGGSLPMRYALTELGCSHNNITAVDFTELHKKLPNLTSLNLSNCPITAFNTKGLEADLFSNSYVTVDLRNTQLSDAVKKEVLKNASAPSVLRDCDGKGGGTASFITILVGGGYILPAVGVASVANSSVLVVVVIGSFFAGMALGFGTTYLGYLTCKSPKKRFTRIYKPLLDNADYPEEEITTRYGRFVKYFPYFCALSKCCHANDPEYAPLNQVEEE